MIIYPLAPGVYLKTSLLRVSVAQGIRTVPLKAVVPRRQNVKSASFAFALMSSASEERGAYHKRLRRANFHGFSPVGVIHRSTCRRMCSIRRPSDEGWALSGASRRRAGRRRIGAHFTLGIGRFTSPSAVAGDFSNWPSVHEDERPSTHAVGLTQFI